MDRSVVFNEEHEMFRQAFRKWLEKEVVPYHDQWEKDGMVPREIWNNAGEQGFLCPTLPEEYGGAGADFLYSIIEIEECARARVTGLSFSLHNDIVVPYIYEFGNEEQKKKWLPKCATG